MNYELRSYFHNIGFKKNILENFRTEYESSKLTLECASTESQE
jgi:hypothetical protein